MESMLNKVMVLVAGVVIAALVWFVFIPYIKEITAESLSKQIRIQSYSNELKPIDVAFGTTTLSVKIADTLSQKQAGLGNVNYIEEDEGMLFVYEVPDYPSIWMKDMFFPIDIAWLDSNFRIVDIEADVSPSTYPESFRPDIPAQYVLKVNAGFFQNHGIGIGSKLQLANDDIAL